MGFLETFSDFKRSTRVVLIVSLLLGLVLLTGFTLTDAGVDLTLWGWDPKPNWLKRYNADWFQDHAYIPNIYAGLTGFLIGAPVATVVLATFTIEREDKAALDRVNKLSALAWDKFRDSMLELCSHERMVTGLQTQAEAARSIHDEIFAEYQRYIALAHTYLPDESKYRGVTDEEVAEFQRYLRERYAPFSKSVDAVWSSVGRQYVLQLQWSTIRTNWATLNQYVRLQRLERNLEWFDDFLDAELTNRLSESQHPLTEFVRVHKFEGSTSSLSMSGALSMVATDMNRPRDELTLKLLAGYTGSGSTPVGSQHLNEFGYKKVEGHKTAARNVGGSLNQLKFVVEDVEKSGWPQNASAPPR